LSRTSSRSVRLAPSLKRRWTTRALAAVVRRTWWSGSSRTLRSAVYAAGICSRVVATPGASPVPVEAAHPRPAWADLPDEELLKVRLADLNLTIEGSWLEARITDLN
jgi:hypothetical protein